MQHVQPVVLGDGLPRRRSGERWRQSTVMLSAVACLALCVIYVVFFYVGPQLPSPGERRAAEQARRIDLLEGELKEATRRLKDSERNREALDAEVHSLRDATASYGVHRGACPRGSDLMAVDDPRILTVQQARSACAAHPDCAGFTFQGESSEPSGLVSVYFKTAFSTVDVEGWWAYGLERRPVLHPPPSVPGAALYDRVKHLITADYDVELMAKTGGAQAKLWWPEYSAPLTRAPAFAYPSLAEDRLLLSVAPRVYLFPDFMSAGEAKAVITAARPKLHRSRVALDQRKKTNESNVKNIRTSFGAWLGDDVPVVRTIRDRIQAITGLPRDSFEDLQVLRYEGGQRYGSHFDYFHPRSYGPQSWNRVATFFLYLEDVDKGGQTTFPMANGGGGRAGVHECSRGLQVRPKAGSAVLFYSMRQDTNLDPYALHGGCPVGDNLVKWACPQWLRLQLPDGLPPESR